MDKRICVKCGVSYVPIRKIQKYCSRDCKRGSAVIRHRQKRQDYLHDLLGGECVICGYSKTNRALEFHHVYPECKEFRLSREGLSFSVQRVTREALKCVILCANCHREEQAGLICRDTLAALLENDTPRRNAYLKGL